MNTVYGTMLGLVIAFGGAACSAQNVPVPFRQLERNAQLSARADMPASEAAVNHPYAILPESSSTSGFVMQPPVYKQPKTLTGGYYLVNGLHLGMASLDVAMTQHCLADHHCVEGNPLMPSSLGGQLSVNFALVGYGAFISYEVKKHETRGWWLSPVVGALAHTAGAATGFVNR